MNVMAIIHHFDRVTLRFVEIDVSGPEHEAPRVALHARIIGTNGRAPRPGEHVRGADGELYRVLSRGLDCLDTGDQLFTDVELSDWQMLAAGESPHHGLCLLEDP